MARTSVPGLLGRRWVVSIIDPTVVEPSGNSAATASIAAFSIRATIAGVASTSMSPEPSARAVNVASTVSVDVCVSPVCMVLWFGLSGWCCGSSVAQLVNLTAVLRGEADIVAEALALVFHEF